MRIKFGEWLPDAGEFENPGITIAQNVLPTINGFRPINGLTSYSGATTVTTGITGVFYATKVNGAGEIFAGTATTLELLGSAQTWSDVSKAGGYGAANWDFAQIGRRVIATNYGAAPQYYDLGVSSLFADLPGSPPSAKVVANVRNFVVMGDTSSDPSAIQWSGFNNSEQWTPSRATQSDTRALNEEFGRIQRIVPGQYGIIFQERGIWRMDYSGPGRGIFNFTQLGRGVGTMAQKSVCWHADRVFFLASDGFYQIVGGGAPQPIGHERVNRWFFSEMDSEKEKIRDVVGAVDPENNEVYWAYNTGAGTFNTNLIIYNWRLDRWSYAVLSHETIASLQFTGNKDAEDDRYKLIAFDTSQQLADFTGSALVARIETSELGGEQNTSIDVLPLVSDAGLAGVTIADGTRNEEDQSETYTSLKALNSIGIANFRDQARYHRVRMDITGGFTDAVGLDVTIKPGSRR